MPLLRDLPPGTRVNVTDPSATAGVRVGTVVGPYDPPNPAWGGIIVALEPGHETVYPPTTEAEILTPEDGRTENARAILAYYGTPEPENDWNPRVIARARYLMVEEGSSAYAGRRWYTTGDDPRKLAEIHDDQEYAEDWILAAIFDLDTGEAVEIKREYLILSRSRPDWLTTTTPEA